MYRFNITKSIYFQIYAVAIHMVFIFQILKIIQFGVFWNIFQSFVFSFECLHDDKLDADFEVLNVDSGEDYLLFLFV